MKTIKYILASFVLLAGMTSCVGDLNIEIPLDPNLNTADKALTTPENYEALLASIYTGFATHGYGGQNGGPSISGLDGGTSQYLRGRHYLNGHPTDEIVCGWNDPGVPDMYPMTWTVDNVVIASFYYRICHQVSLANEFIRQANAATIDLPEKARWIAEARALRAYCWLDGIDNFGNMPFADETSVVGAKGPDQIKRADLFDYVESECKALLEGNDLYDYNDKNTPYGRVNKGFVAMVLAKLYLNAEVYVGKKMYQECANVLAALDGKYALHTKTNGTKYNAFQELFLADNHKCTEEIIFAVQADANNTTSWGATQYLVFGFVGGEMDPEEFGISSGWGGPRSTPEYYKKFVDKDARYLFHTEGQTIEIEDPSQFKYGPAYTKFRNMNSDGTPGQLKGCVDTDFPLFRYADALLMKAECELKGATGANGLDAMNTVRARAGLEPVKALNTSDLLDERARELALEGWRRSDLIRFGKFTSGYNWSWKGGVKAGKDMPDHLALFPIPQSDRNSNPKLEQNKGY